MGLSLIATVACLLSYVVADAPYHTDLESYQAGALGTEPNQTFYSSPIVAPILQVNRFDADKIDFDAAPYIFTAGGWNGTWGSIIHSSKDLSVVYQDYNYDALAQATRAWKLHGEKVYSALEGGAFRIFNQSYDQLYELRPQGDLKDVGPDTHEGVITDDGTVLLIACPAETVDLSEHDGPSDAQVANCMIQEIDPDTNEVLFEFASLDYFDPWDSFMSAPEDGVWDYCHQNSVQKIADGDYIASYRHLSAVIKIDGSSGEVKWVMGGKRNDFKDVSSRPGAAFFAYQHEAREWHTNTSFTIFDNAQLPNGFCDGKNCSRGLELEYDERNMTVKMVDEWYHPQSLISSSRGGVQKMDSGHVFIAWGQNYGWTEHDEDGECILDFQRGRMANPGDVKELVTYRGWKDTWMPQPPWGPNVSAVDNHVYVSWNGRLVSDWLLLVSDSRDDLDAFDKAVAISPRNGFETSFDLADHGSPKYARVAALRKDGIIAGATPVVDISSGELFDEDSDMKFTKADSSKTTDLSSSKGVAVPTGDASTEQFQPPEDEETEENAAWRVGPMNMLCIVAIAISI